MDPYRVHEDRWYSYGEPTKLVRDAGVESYDPPPASVEPAGPLVRPVVHGARSGADDLRRADDAQHGDSYDPKKANQAAFDVIDLHVRP
jgi:hypothetical protein